MINYQLAEVSKEENRSVSLGNSKLNAKKNII
jgi:hypothetical protein